MTTEQGTTTTEKDAKGQDLRSLREGRGLSVRDVHDILRINPLFLSAIEEGRFDLLPEPVYARAFIKAYAAFLGADEAAILKRYDDHLRSRGQDEETGKEPDGPPPARKKRIFPILMVVLAIVAFVGVLSILVFRGDLSEKTSPPAGRDVPAPPQAAPSAAPTPVAPAGGWEGVKEAKGYDLVIEGRETTWLRISTDDGDPEEFILRKGEKLERSAKKGFTLLIGNAGGVRVSFQGRDLGDLGPPGRVVRLRLPEKDTH